MADPLAILGAVAASLQLAVYAIKGPVGTVELVQSLHEAPRRMSLLLSQIDREVASTNNLLRFDPPIHPYLSTTQYAQISTLAVEARKAMESIQEDLRPLVEAIQSASEPSEKRKVLIQAWKSVATIKKEKEIESKMKLLERLNVSLLRELHIAGFETQSLLRNESSQILKNTATSVTSIQEARRSIQQICERQSQAMKTDQSNTTSITQSLDALRHDISINHKSHDRNIASTSQSLVQMAGDLSALRQDTTSSSSQIQALLLEHRDEIRREFQAKNNNLAELVCAQVIAYPTKLLQDILDKLSAPMVLTIQQAHEGKDHSTNSQDSALEFDLQRGTARLELSNRAAQPRLGLDDLVKPHKYPNPLRCSCRSKRSTTRWDYKQFWFRIENNAVQGCSIHGRKQERAYSIEAKLSPFLKRTLVFTLGYLKEKNSPEMALSLKLKSVVERAKSPIFSLFDSFFDERTVNVPKGQTSACRQREIGLLEEDGLGGRVLTWVNRIWRGFR